MHMQFTSHHKSPTACLNPLATGFCTLILILWFFSIMATDPAQTLTLLAKRTLALPSLPTYESDLVRLVVREIRALASSANATIDSLPPDFNPAEDPGTSMKIVVEVSTMRRDKRCLLAYHRVRTDKIAEGVWKGLDFGGDEATRDEEGVEGEGWMGDGAGGERSGPGSSALSPEEEEYARGYAELLAAVKSPWMDIDLTGSLVPPRDLFVDVRVLKDAGEIQTEYG
jgi:GINS complex subunit 1